MAVYNTAKTSIINGRYRKIRVSKRALSYYNPRDVRFLKKYRDSHHSTDIQPHTQHNPISNLDTIHTILAQFIPHVLTITRHPRMASSRYLLNNICYADNSFGLGSGRYFAEGGPERWPDLVPLFPPLDLTFHGLAVSWMI
jgi:hypothetical protein